jgi:cilia- and flagella-associated protein 52
MPAALGTDDPDPAAGGWQLWSWDEGVVLGVGKGHSGTITRVKISPDLRTIISCGQDGAILLWTMPERLIGAPPPPAKATSQTRKQADVSGPTGPSHASCGP